MRTASGSRRRMVASMRNGRTWAAAVMRRLGRPRRADGERGAVLVEAVDRDPDPHDDHARHHRVRRRLPAGRRRRDRRPAPAPVWRRHSRRPTSAVPAPTAATPRRHRAGRGSSALQSVGSRRRRADVRSTTVERRQGTRPAELHRLHVQRRTTRGTRHRRASALVRARYGLARRTSNACARTTTGLDQIGIWVRVTHTAVTHMFGGNKTLTGNTIMRLEPYVGTRTCAAS